MTRALGFGVMSAAMAALAATAGAQVESHCLPASQMPPILLPSWVAAKPSLDSQETSPPLVPPTAGALKPVAAAAGGRPDATRLADMCQEPREVIRLAEAGKSKEAIEAGRPLLAQPREKYRDYTWDYLANAIAWSGIQTGDLKVAVAAHTAVVSRIDDPAVSDYHRIVLAMLGQTKKSAAELKNYSTYQAEVRARLADRLESFKVTIAAAEKDRSSDAMLGHLREAYEKLRLLVAVEPEAGKAEPLAAFRKAVQGLSGQAIAPAVADAEQMTKRLDEVAAHGYANRGIHLSEWGHWNGDVLALWGNVQEIKRVCRIQDYLVQMRLADAGGSRKLFQQAHACLFVPSNTSMIWQQVGQKRMVLDIEHLDIRLRIPWDETRITPWGVPFSGRLATPPGWKPMKSNPIPRRPG